MMGRSRTPIEPEVIQLPPIAPPTIRTERLIIGPYQSDDADDIARLAGAPEVFDTTLNIPFPYELNMAVEWLSTHAEKYEKGIATPLKIQHADTGDLVGGISLMNIDDQHSVGELGYWIAVSYWNRGYATEASRAVLEYGFTTLNLNRIHAHHFSRNPASGRVLIKIGMQHEGRLRQAVRKLDHYENIELYAILQEDDKAEKP